MKKIFGYGLFFFLGLGIALISSSVMASNATNLNINNYSTSTLSGVYALIMGKLDAIQRACVK